MRYFKRQKKGHQVYIILVETTTDGSRKETYIGNIKSITEDILDEVNKYFSEKDAINKFKSDNDYDEFLDDTLSISSKKFGDMWLL